MAGVRSQLCGVGADHAPGAQFYGIDTVATDNSGNWFRLCQRPAK